MRWVHFFLDIYLHISLKEILYAERIFFHALLCIVFFVFKITFSRSFFSASQTLIFMNVMKQKQQFSQTASDDTCIPSAGNLNGPLSGLSTSPQYCPTSLSFCSLKSWDCLESTTMPHIAPSLVHNATDREECTRPTSPWHVRQNKMQQKLRFLFFCFSRWIVFSFVSNDIAFKQGWF